MSSLIRGIRSSYRSKTPDGEGPKLRFHLLLSILFSVAISAISSVFDHNDEIISNFDILLGFIGTIFALLFTVLAIILAFEGQYSENRAIKELKRTGHYSSIFQRFYLSAFSIGALFILLGAIAIFGIHKIDILMQIPSTSIVVNLIELGSLLLVSGGFLLAVLRVSSCFAIYYRIEIILRNHENGE